MSVKRKLEHGEGGRSPRDAKLETEQEQYQWSEFENRLFSGFSRLKSDDKMCDFIVVIEGEKFHVHRAVLAASSRFYEAMLTHDTIEERNGCVEIHDVTLPAGKQCLEFMYTGKTDFSPEDPENLIFAAEMMQLSSLSDQYFEFLKGKLSVDNCLKLVTLAETYNLHAFAVSFKKFAAEKFVELVHSDHFKTMCETLVERWLDAAGSSDRNLESLKWTGIVEWVNFDKEARKNSFPKLFAHLKLEKLSEEFIKKNIGLENLIMEFDPCLRRVLEALQSISKVNHITSSSPIVIHHSESRLLHHYDIDTRKWSRLSRIPDEVTTSTIDTIWCNKHVYVGTGKEIFKLKSDWTKVVNIEDQNVQVFCTLTTHDNILYMVTRSYIIRYETDSDVWKKIPALLGYTSFNVTAGGEYLYAVQGNTAKEFDFVTAKWEHIANLSQSAYQSCPTFYKRWLFVITLSAEVIFYDPDADCWTTFPASVSAQGFCTGFFKAFAINNEVFMVSGNTVTPLKLPDPTEIKNIAAKFSSELSCSASLK